MPHARKIFSREEVLALFESEFAPIRAKFAIHDLQLQAARNNSEQTVNGPGVYIHWRADLGVIKVGKHRSNAKSRAFDHLRDNSRTADFEMKSLENDTEARLLLLNIRLPRDLHWIESIESYIEVASEPLIPSGRVG